MALTADQITAQNFKDFYGEIRPYLNGSVPTFANAFNRSDLYSTDEKIIGCWTDGKPVYQRTWTGLSISTTAGNWTTLPFTIPNCDFIVDARLYRGDLKALLAVVTIQHITSDNRIDFVVQETRSDIHTVTLQYTKTTDQAIKVGTGNDYSTDEQIIGTWIDGKPLYQKTYECSHISVSNSGTNISSAITNASAISKIISAVCLEYTSGSTYTPYIDKQGSTLTLYTKDVSSTFLDYITLQYTKTTD